MNYNDNDGDDNNNNNNDNAPERWDSDTSEAEDEVNAGEDGEPKEPEPQEEEHLHHSLIDEEFLKEKKGHLFIDNVERENTETVELLLSSSSAHRVEGAAMQQIYHTLKVSGDNKSLHTW